MGNARALSTAQGKAWSAMQVKWVLEPSIWAEQLQIEHRLREPKNSPKLRRRPIGHESCLIEAGLRVGQTLDDRARLSRIAKAAEAHSYVMLFGILLLVGVREAAR